MKPTFKLGNINFSTENPETGRKESLTIEGIEVQCELSLQELVQLNRDAALASDRILRFFKGELPDMIRNCGRAIGEVREIQNKQKLVYKEQRFLLKQRLKAHKKAEEQKEQEQPYKGPDPRA